MIDVRVQASDFDPGRQAERLGELGAAAVLGLTLHAEAGEDVEAVLIEHYAAMARDELARIAAEADARWPLAGIVLVHRHGRLAPGDRLFHAGVAASDPETAQQALAFLLAQTRTRAPFWRRDLRVDPSAPRP